MRKLITIVVLLMLSLSACSEKEEVITMNELPSQARTFISTYWPNVEATALLKETHGCSTEFKVILADATTIDFDKKGVWEDVENNVGIPTGFILKPITDYVAQHFSGAQIIEISKDKKNFDVELNTGINLVFDVNGNFKRIDS